MQWTLSNDLDAYVANALPLLAVEPARNTVALTVLDQLRSGHQFSDLPPTFGWCITHGRVVGAVFMTPPYDLGLAVVPLDSVDSLVGVLLSLDISVPGVIGDPEACDAFVAQWPGARPREERSEQRQRLYILDQLVAPDPPPAGAARPATVDDVELLVAWTAAFHVEAGGRATPRDTEVVRRRIDLGLLWVWETEDAVVAMSGRNVTAVGVARIGPVYTPPEHRRHGYGAAVTAACTADALARDAKDAVLFTDLANPTSNRIYQRIGYHPVTDRVVYRFERLPGS